MKICHITTNHPIYDTRIYQKQCASLALLGHEVHLIAGGDGSETSDIIHIHCIGLPPLNKFKRFLIWPWKVIRIARSINADIYQFHDHELLPPMWVMKWVFRKKIIYDMHENVAAQFISQMNIFLKLPSWIRQRMAGLYRLMESLLTIGMGIIESDMIQGRFEPRSISIRNLPRLAGHKRREPSKLDFETARPVLIYVGGVSVPRGVWDMLEVAKRLRYKRNLFELHIIGPFQPLSIEQKIKEYVEEQGLESYVKFTGRLSYQDTLQAISKATIGLTLLHSIENYQFALPTKILEYMMFGIPVVSSDIPCASRYVFENDVGIVINLENIDSIVDEIDRLLENSDKLMRFSQNGIQAVWEGDLNWEREFPRLLVYYNWILEKGERNWLNYYHRYIKDSVEGAW